MADVDRAATLTDRGAKRYRSRDEAHAMRWPAEPQGRQSDLSNAAAVIIAWINENGGEAEYRPFGVAHSPYQDIPQNSTPAIAVMTCGAWWYAWPGDYVMAQTNADAEHKFTPMNAEIFTESYAETRETSLDLIWEADRDE